MCCKKKMGRPTDNPKTRQVGIRLDQKCQDILDKYTEQYGVNVAEAARRGIMKLEEEIKK